MKCEVCGEELKNSFLEDVARTVCAYPYETNEYPIFDKYGNKTGNTIFLCEEHRKKHLVTSLNTIKKQYEKEQDELVLQKRIEKKRIIEVLKCK